MGNPRCLALFDQSNQRIELGTCKKALPDCFAGYIVCVGLHLPEIRNRVFEHRREQCACPETSITRSEAEGSLPASRAPFSKVGITLWEMTDGGWAAVIRWSPNQPAR
jgi:hypothetical protein